VGGVGLRSLPYPVWVPNVPSGKADTAPTKEQSSWTFRKTTTALKLSAISSARRSPVSLRRPRFSLLAGTW